MIEKNAQDMKSHMHTERKKKWHRLQIFNIFHVPLFLSGGKDQKFFSLWLNVNVSLSSNYTQRKRRQKLHSFQNFALQWKTAIEKGIRPR